MKFAQSFLLMIFVLLFALPIIYPYFMPYEFMILTSSFLYFVLVIFLFRTFYLRDTFVDSAFFSIDRVRTIRYVTGYFLVLFVSAALTLFGGLVILGALGSLVTGIVISVINFIIFLIWIVNSFFTTSSLQFLSYNIVPEVFTSIISFGSNISEQVGYVLIVLFIFIALAFASYFLGRYVEDSDTALAAILYTHLIFFSFLMTASMSMVLRLDLSNPILVTGLESDLVYLLIPPITVLLSYFLSRQVFLLKETQDQYELPELNQWIKRLISLIYFVISVLLLLAFGNIGYNILVLNILSHVPTLIGITLISLPSVVLIFLLLAWVIRGDYPTDIRIFEIEYREQLLEEAEEFKAL